MREREWQARKYIKSLRRNLTDAECKLWQELRGRRLQEFKFRRQHPIERYVADFACISEKLIVEIDGVTHSENLNWSMTRSAQFFWKSWGGTLFALTMTMFLMIWMALSRRFMRLC